MKDHFVLYLALILTLLMMALSSFHILKTYKKNQEALEKFDKIGKFLLNEEKSIDT